MKYIDQSTWPRREIFTFFNAMDYPHFNVCAMVEIGPLYRAAKEKGQSISHTVLYAVCKAANLVPEMRHRIRGDEVVEHELVHPSITVLNKQNLFGFCEVKFAHDVKAFLQNAAQTIEAAKTMPIDLSDTPGRDDYLFATVLPWVRFTATTHPIHMNPVDSVPRIAWGKHQKQGDSVTMPLSFQVHHAVADGFHVGLVFKHLEEIVQGAEELLAEV